MQQRILKLAILATIPFSGLIVMFGGLVYDVMFAGIPSQDSTPEMQASYQFHSDIASIIRNVGGFIFLGGLLLTVVLTPVIIWRKPRPAMS